MCLNSMFVGMTAPVVIKDYYDDKSQKSPDLELILRGIALNNRVSFGASFGLAENINPDLTSRPFVYKNLMMEIGFILKEESLENQYVESFIKAIVSCYDNSNSN